MPNQKRAGREGPPLLGLTMGVVAIGVEALVMAPVLNDIAAALRTTPARAAWAVSAYGFALALAAPLVALAGRRVSRKTTLTAGLWLFVLAGVGCALAPGIGWLIVARAVGGVAAGIFLPACYAYVGDATAYAQRGRAMGRVMAGWSLALIVGVPLGGLIAEYGGWRATFLAVSALAGVAIFLLARWPVIPPLPEGAPAHPLAPAVLWSRGMPWLLAVNFLDMLSFYGVYTLLGVAVSQRLDMGSRDFGLLVLLYGVGLLTSTSNGHWLDRFGKTRLLAAALGLLSVVLASLDLALGQAAALGACMWGWGLFQGVAQTGLTTLVSHAAGPARSLAMACMSCTTYLAVGLGSLAGGHLLEAHGFAAVAAAGAMSALCALGALAMAWRAMRRP